MLRLCNPVFNIQLTAAETILPKKFTVAFTTDIRNKEESNLAKQQNLLDATQEPVYEVASKQIQEHLEEMNFLA